MKILFIILSGWLLTGCIIFPGPIGVVGEYGAVTVQPNPVIVEPSYNTYYTTPYTTGNMVYYSPQVIVPPPKSSYYNDYRPQPYYYSKPYHYHKPQPYYHHKPYYGPKPYYKKYKLQPY